jgi:hypothetical protein
MGIAALVAGCGSAAVSPSAGQGANGNPTAALTTTGPSASPAAPFTTPAASGSRASGSPKASAGASLSAAPSSACLSVGLGSVDRVLEAYLPCTIGGVDLERFSMTLANYIASGPRDAELYAPWLVAFGLTPAEVNMAVVADLTQQENFVVHAIKVPGVDDAKLASSFAEQAKKAGWPVTQKTVTGRQLLEMTDPAAKAAGSLSVGYVFASNHILYTIITDDPSLLVEALIKLP